VKVEEGQWKAEQPIYRFKLIQIPDTEAEANRMNMEGDSSQAQESAQQEMKEDQIWFQQTWELRFVSIIKPTTDA